MPPQVGRGPVVLSKEKAAKALMSLQQTDTPELSSKEKAAEGLFK